MNLPLWEHLTPTQDALRVIQVAARGFKPCHYVLTFNDMPVGRFTTGGAAQRYAHAEWVTDPR